MANDKEKKEPNSFTNYFTVEQNIGKGDITAKHIMAKCNIKYYQQFARLAEKFNLRPSVEEMHLRGKQRKVYRAREASKFVERYREYVQNKEEKRDALTDRVTNIENSLKDIKKIVNRNRLDTKGFADQFSNHKIHLHMVDRKIEKLSYVENENRDLQEQLRYQEQQIINLTNDVKSLKKGITHIIKKLEEGVK